MAKAIVELLPPSNYYIEPFAGMGAVMLAHPRRDHEMLNDADGRVMTFWRILRDRPHELAARLAATPYGRGALEEAGEILADDDADYLSVAAATACWLDQHLHSVLPPPGKRQKGLWAQPAFVNATGRLLWVEESHWRGVGRDVLRVAERMSRVTLECGDGVELIERYAPAREALIYCDPPYEGTASYATGCDFERMADACRTAKARIAISGAPRCPWDELLGWERVDLSTTRREAGSEQGNAPTSGAKECLWVNYPVPARLPFG